MNGEAPDLIAALAGVDTPTVCNALITLDASLKGRHYTLDPVVPGAPDLPPFTGYALTAKIVSSEPPADGHDALLARRFAYYRYLSQARRPSLVVMQDCGSRRGLGSIWGEINASIHKAMGLAGAVTDGAIRDLGSLPSGFQLIGGNVCPGSGFAHLVDFDTPVQVFGLAVSPGDLVHADRHGCVVIPPALAPRLPAAIGRVVQREKALLNAVNAPGFDCDRLIAAWRQFEIK
jgi:regulator of RNase E activity RraA